jgi:hypothetical protein
MVVVALLVLLPTVTATAHAVDMPTDHEEKARQGQELLVVRGLEETTTELEEEAKQAALDEAQTLLGNEESSRNKAAGGEGGRDDGPPPVGDMGKERSVDTIGGGEIGRPPPRPMPDSAKGKDVEKHAKEHQANLPQGKPWWVPSINQTEAGAEQQQQQPAWKGECEGEWGYEGYTQKAGKPHGQGGGGNSSRPEGEEGQAKEKIEFQQRCKQFNESLTYIQGFEKANPNAAFKVGVNNMSDWSPAEKQTLYGVRGGMVVDEGKVLDMEDMATVEGLITGTITYDEVFPATAATAATAGFSMVEETDSIANLEEGGGRRRRAQSRGKGPPLPSSPTISPLPSPSPTAVASRLPSSSSTSVVPEVVLPASLDYRYKDANPYGVVAVTPVKSQGKCGR